MYWRFYVFNHEKESAKGFLFILVGMQLRSFWTVVCVCVCLCLNFYFKVLDDLPISSQQETSNNNILFTFVFRFIVEESQGENSLKVKVCSLSCVRLCCDRIVYMHGHQNENKYIVENGLDCFIWFSHHISISFFRFVIFMHPLQQQHSYWLYIKVIIVEWLEYFEILTFLISNILRANVWFISWAWLSCKCGCVSGRYVCVLIWIGFDEYRGEVYVFCFSTSCVCVCGCLLLTPYSKLLSIIVRKKTIE